MIAVALGTPRVPKQSTMAEARRRLAALLVLACATAAVATALGTTHEVALSAHAQRPGDAPKGVKVRLVGAAISS